MSIRYARSPFPSYVAWLRGYGAGGYGTTVEEALDDLAAQLRDSVAVQLPIEGDLRSALAEAAGRAEPILDSADEARVRNHDPATTPHT